MIQSRILWLLPCLFVFYICNAQVADFAPKALVKTEVSPQKIEVIDRNQGLFFIDFGKSAFATIRFQATAVRDNQVVTVHLGEVINQAGTRINRDPGGSRRYRAMQQPLKRGTHWYEVTITPDKRNTGPKAIKMPKEIGEVMPFRYCELENFPGSLKNDQIVQIRVHYPFDDAASYFHSSNKVLNDVWELCKYSIKATSFTGVYVDGDRERIPYEGDAYINQIAHYCLDDEYAMTRVSLEYLMKHPTWPVEWHQHIPLMAWDEYLYTGDTSFIADYYDAIVAKMLLPLQRKDGLLTIGDKAKDPEFLKTIGMRGKIRTLVDWPSGERNKHKIKPTDSVVNAFFYRNLVLMSKMADAIGKTDDSKRFKQEAERVYASYQQIFFDQKKGIYRDGEGVDHSSIHSNLFPLAFGLVPEDKQESVVEFIKTKGMACSVYASQHLLDGLYRAGAEDYALSLLTSTAERSWAHMIYDVGSTITLEAWDDRFKPNQDWNHAWGAAPANLIPRRLMGIMPIEPGFRRVRIHPQVGSLAEAIVKKPTLLGKIQVKMTQNSSRYQITVSIPERMQGELVQPDGVVKELESGISQFTVLK